MATISTSGYNRLMASADTRHTISIVIPSTNNAIIGDLKLRADASPALRELVVTAVCKVFAKTHGGYNRVDKVGGWLDIDTGDLVEEFCTTIEAAVGSLTPETVNQLFDLAHKVRAAFQQDAVMITIDHAAWFIGADSTFPPVS